MEIYPIDSNEEYDYLITRGRVPLLDKYFSLEIGLRYEKQKELFGLVTFNRDIPRANERFYRWVWDNKKHVCDECLRPLGYSATHISHIITKGAHPEMAHDPRNTNILCYKHHEQWETGKRSHMRIYPGNQLIIENLKSEYAKLNNRKLYETDRISRE